MRVLGHRGSAGRPDRPENTLAAGRGAVVVTEVVARDSGLDELHLPVQVLRRGPEAVGRARAVGLRVLLWTVNAVGDVRAARDLGVSEVITDSPWLAAAALAPSSGPRPGGGVRRRRGALVAPR